MYLSDVDIKRAIKNGEIVYEPYNDANISTASIDLRLGEKIIIVDEPGSGLFPGPVFDWRVDINGRLTSICNFKHREMILEPGRPFFLLPRKFILGHTLENVGPASSRICGVLSDKSTLARAGLRTHGNAGFIEPTNVLRPTLEIYNDGALPIALYFGMHIAQMRFARMESACENGYSSNGKYAYSQTVELPK